MTFHSVGNGTIIPTDFHSMIFQRGRYTTSQILRWPCHLSSLHFEGSHQVVLRCKWLKYITLGPRKDLLLYLFSGLRYFQSSAGSMISFKVIEPSFGRGVNTVLTAPIAPKHQPSTCIFCWLELVTLLILSASDMFQ